MLVATGTPALAHPALIPLPTSVAWGNGDIPLGPNAVVSGKGATAPSAAFLARSLGIKQGERGSTRILLRLVPARTIGNPEGYHLRVDRHGVLIEASDPRGLFYGAQTLRQMVSGGRVAVADISDAPRFLWRGLLIDVARHFYGKPVLFKFLDQMAVYKLNVLHLHLTDDPGWRIEIPGYPKLTKGEITADGSRAYFTAADIRDIVAYAAERHIMVIPEIEMPSHSGSAGTAYPELYNGGNALDPASPTTYAFIRSVFGEVGRLFPAPYIHFGGDEVGDDAWKDMPDVRQLKVAQDLGSTKEVEAYFVRNVVKIIEANGRRPMAWDEQAEAGASSDVVIQWWRKARPDVLDAAAARGSELVVSPVDQVYFDYHQGPGEPGAPWEGNDNGPTSIAKILAWEPVPASFTPEESKKVLGVEAAVWTEFIASRRYLEFMTFPRLLAFAEVAWRPKGGRDEADFSTRLTPHLDALRASGINARRDEGDAYEFITH
ncbi:beta-N-acetylhexosaminidase [Sphingomonas sp.]|uniref:beta-N-acetylhexosaminidase n=1 Tax=Sphingomonas sp. TaxID=28214 RepID=UPI0025D52E35|nr:beta-N-acetylhexosaminidase [Sphingomonas sp.]MBV9528977.1 beta-N-acetylhexosaminidase [Sphingomonas sp.]